MRDAGRHRRRRALAAAHPGVLRRPSSTPASTCSSSAARRSPPSTSRAQAEPLNLKQFIYELDVPVIVGGCATYTAALHLMRTGAAGVLVGFGGGAAHTTRTVLGIARADGHARSPTSPAARRDYLDESGGRYVHVIADGGDRPQRRHRQGDRLRRRRGDDRLAARPRHRGARPRLPLGRRGPPRRAAARRAGRGRHGRHRSRRSCSARRASPTAR